MPDIDFSALSRFSHANFKNGNTVASLDPDNDSRLKNAGTYQGAVGALLRSEAEKASNNAVRTELLKSLGQAFHIEGMNDQGDGKVTFNKAFMDRLGKLFGAELKQEDFGIAADGSVASGRPLTQRRITAILNKAASYADLSKEFSLDVYAAKSKAFIEQFNSLGDKRTPAGKRLAQSLGAAVSMLCLLDTAGADEKDREALLEANSMFDPDRADTWHYKKWIISSPSESGEWVREDRTNENKGLQEALKTSGLDINLNLGSIDELGTDEKSVSAFNSAFTQKLQAFVKTACDAWNKVQQGQVTVDRFLQAFSDESAKSEGLAAFLDNMQALEAAG